MKRTSLIITAICILTFVGTARATELYVPDDYNTIQAAIDAAVDGDTVIVADGTYTGAGNHDIDFLGKAITVKSENGPENCIIDCEDTENNFYRFYRGFVFHNGEDANSILDGLTITNGYMPDNLGSGIACWGDSSPTIKNCIIIGNSGDNGTLGGGIYCGRDASPIIANCTISGNSAGGGGGICCRDSSPKITNCTFAGNSAQRYGGGIYCCGSSPKITNCTFAGNKALRLGSAIACVYSVDAEVRNCTITGNRAGRFPEHRGGAIACADINNLTIANSILWDNAVPTHFSEECDITIIYTDIQGGWEGIGNVDADPCFIESGHWADANDPNVMDINPWDPNAVWVDGDYHLLPNSPCIDTGDPNYIPEPNETDLDGNPRIANGRIDMGAYEYIPPLVAQVRISPKSLNLQSKGRWVSCYIVLPEDYNVADIDPNSILLEDEIAPDRVVLYGRLAVAKFSRSAVQELLSEMETPGEAELLVSGQLTDGTIFEGTDIIRIVGRERKRILRRRIGR